MLSTLKRVLVRRREDERGFTLIELMVVLLIIAILIAIAIPTYLGARNRANDRAAQSTLRNVLTTAKSEWSNSQDYTALTETELQGDDSSLTWEVSGTGSNGPNAVSWDGSATDTFAAAVLSNSKTCFFIKTIETGTSAGTYYGETTSTDQAGCVATATPAVAYSQTTKTGWA